MQLLQATTIGTVYSRERLRAAHTDFVITELEGGEGATLRLGRPSVLLCVCFFERATENECALGAKVIVVKDEATEGAVGEEGGGERTNVGAEPV